tara:strand:- start:621 stop:1925 length:1305 start_codon:yes stop_codon:yes gene_type:complete
VINYFKIFFFIILLTSCSLNPNSSLWTKDKKINIEDARNIKDITKKESILQREINPNIKINFSNAKKINSFQKQLTNNDGFTNYNGDLKKISKFKYSKIDNFNQYEPTISAEKNNIIFFDNKGSILKFDNNSKLVWKSNYYSKREIKNKPVLFFSNNQNILIVADTLAKYYALDINNGNILWSKNNTSPFNSQIKILNDKFYVVDDANNLICFSLKDGKKLWNYKAESSLIKSQKKISIVVQNEKIIFNSSLGDLTAVHIDTGKLIWQTPTQKQSVYEDAMFLKNSDLVIANDSVLFSNNTNEFFSIDLTTGLLNWKQSINSSLRPAYVDNYIFTISEEGYLFVIDFKSGNIIRSTYIIKNLKLKKRNKFIPVGFIVGSNNIYLTTSTGRLFIIDIKTGITQKIIKIDNEKISRPIALRENIYITKNDSIIKLN